MIARGLIARLAALLASTALVQACASQPTGLRDAVLLDVDEPSVREALRLAVREGSGNQVRADLDSLRAGSVLRLVELGRPAADELMRVTAAPPTYRLMVDDRGRCYLSREGAEPLMTEMPRAARCQPV